MLIATCALAHDPRLDLPEPKSVPEAWNVIVESTDNVDKLIELGQWPEVAFQLANVSPALRTLEAHATEMGGPGLKEVTQRLLHCGFDVVLASREKENAVEKAKGKWKEYRGILKELESRYPAETLKAAVYICPMHPKDAHTDPAEKCTVCRMSLVRRHIPASDVYEKPGEPSIRMAVVAAPLEAGKPAEVKIKLTRAADGSPVTLGDLITMHTRKIHLLINDRSLSDYHHEHPTETQTPGEYRFSFKPKKPGPYRVWADVVPAATGIQEYVIADIPGTGEPLVLSNRETVMTATVDGRRYDLALQTAGKPLRAGETVMGTLTVTGADGKPFTQLEPVMQAFAHIVGFDEDGKTVLHIHPLGEEPTKPEIRSGPALAFRLYAPSPGFIRLYGQVQIDGVSQFPAFGITVESAASK